MVLEPYISKCCESEFAHRLRPDCRKQYWGQ